MPNPSSDFNNVIGWPINADAGSGVRRPAAGLSRWSNWLFPMGPFPVPVSISDPVLI